MKKRVYYSRYANDQLAVEVLELLFEGSWPVIGSPEGRSLERLCGVWVNLVGPPMFGLVAHLAEQRPAGSPLTIEDAGIAVLMHAVFGEALRRWPETGVLDLEFQEEHARRVDRQMLCFELTGERARFWALLHLVMGELCEASEKQREADRAAGRVGATVISGLPASGRFSLMDLLTAVYSEMERRANGEPEMPRRFQIGVEALFRGAETVINLGLSMKR